MRERIKSVVIFLGICLASAVLAGAIIFLVRMYTRVSETVSERTYRIGILYRTEVLRPMIDSFKTTLGASGYIEGKNVMYEQYNSYADPALRNFYIGQIISHQPDLILALGGPVAEAVQQKTTTIPVVYYTLLDPIAEKLIASFRSSGNNLVGIGGAQEEIRQVEVMKHITPLTNGFGAIVFPSDQLSLASLQRLQAAAQGEQVTIVPKNVTSMDTLGTVLDELKAKGITSVYLTPGAIAGENSAAIAQAAIAHRVLLMGVGDGFVVDGALVSVHADSASVGEELAGLAGKILNGTKPMDLSSSFPTKTSFVLNQKTADTLGITLPADYLTQATKVY